MANYTEERVSAATLRTGQCHKGACSEDAACKNFPNSTYICICPHDNSLPTANGTCPRNVVPIKNKIFYLPPTPNNTSTTTTTNETNSKVLGTTVATANFPSIYYTAAILPVICVLLLISICWHRKYRHAKNASSPSPIVLKRSLLVPDRYARNPQYSACTSASVAVLRRETLHFVTEIGEGCFGKVFKGEWYIDGNDQPDTVAIKVLKESASSEAEEDFLREVDIMSAFRHKHILSLLGVVLREENAMPMMVFEFMAHGDLAEVLRAQKQRYCPAAGVGSGDGGPKPVLERSDLLAMAAQIAAGMQYLAAQRFVHRDLACRNCLVAAGPTVKIADFGMSRDVYTCDYYKIGGTRLLPVRWMSPESVMYGRFTLESDIWSYGVVLWEIFSYGKQPYYGHTNDQVVRLILQDIMLIPPDDCPQHICQLMQLCWKTEPRDRIRFNEICERLEKSAEIDQSATTESKPNTTEDVLPTTTTSTVINETNQNTIKRLPRPPPLFDVQKVDLLDPEGYLLPNSVSCPAPYLETL